MEGIVQKKKKKAVLNDIRKAIRNMIEQVEFSWLHWAKSLLTILKRGSMES